MTEEQNVVESTEKTESQDSEANGFKTGDIMDGTITHITKFGAFVRLESGQEGMVHISEIANEYVTDINNYVKVGDKIKVKILTAKNDKKLELSIRRSTKDESETLFIHKKTKNQEFEEKMSKFLKTSEEKQIDVRRNLKNKQGITKRRR